MFLEALHLCLECNSSIFNNKFYLQADGTAQGTHISCSYSYIAMEMYDKKAMDHPFKHLIWKRFCDDVIALWIHSDEDAITSTPLICQVRLDLLWKLKMKAALNF